MRRQRKVWILGLTGALLVVALGCGTIDFANLDIETIEVGELQRETRVVELGDAEEVRANVRMGAGNLEIGGGAAALMEADFAYNVAEWQPEVEYEDERLTVRQPRSEKLPFDEDVQYEWDLAFNNDVPLDLRIDFGAGNGEVDLRDLSVTNLDMKLGAGDVELDAQGNETLERFELDMGAGDVRIDLRGAWTDDVDVTIQGGVGKTTLRLPEDIGVRVSVTKGIGGINADGFRIDDGDYVNDAYDDADAVIYVTIQAGIGQINLELD
jgi:hypothetical protein